MRGFNDARFANSFSRVCMAANPNLRLHRWETSGVLWTREKHSFQGAEYAFQCETHILKSLSHSQWSFLYVRETWWDGEGKTAVRNNAWGRLLAGRKNDALAWLKAQEALLERMGG